MVLRTKPEKKEEKEKTRVALIRAALGLAATFGFASLSLREVSREAAIAPTSFYRHFGDMEELGLAIIKEAVVPALLGVTLASRGTATRDRHAALALAEALLLAVGEDPNLFRFLFAERVGGSKTFRAALAICIRQFTEDLECTLLEGSVQPAPSLNLVAQVAVTLALESGFQGLDLSNEARLDLLANMRAQIMLVAAKNSAPLRSGSGHDPR